MPRQLRIEYPGAIYHPPSFNFGATSVMNRGDRREPIFHDDTGLIRPCEFQDWQG